MKKPRTDAPAGVQNYFDLDSLHIPGGNFKKYAKKDGRVMAELLGTLKGGLPTFNMVHDRFEFGYFPFWEQTYLKTFREELINDSI